jgi:hypothetical protein
MKRLALLSFGAAILLILSAASTTAEEYSFPVEHKHIVGSCKGDLKITDDGIEYRAKEHSRKWAYTDIKLIRIAQPKAIEITSYESSWLKAGGDRIFEFRLTSRELSDDLSRFLLSRVDRPLVTNSVGMTEGARFTILSRHRHRFGGCQGTIKLFADRVVYESDDPDESRQWRYSDIQSISRAGPYRLTVATFEPQFGGPARTFNFDLKERLDDAVYDYLWARVYKVPSVVAPR